MRAAASSTRDRLLHRHVGEVRLLCALALGDAAEAAAAADATMDRAASARAAGTRPAHPRPWLLAIALEECDRRGGLIQDDGSDPWEPVRRLPADERAALILHEGLGLGVRQTARAIGVDWRAATDLLFTARRALARPGEGWEPLACTAQRRRLSDAGCRRVPSPRSREHLEGCEGCRGMLSSSAERRAAAHPVALAAPTAPAGRDRTGRWALAVAAGLTAIVVAFAVVLTGGGGPAPPAAVSAAEPVAAAVTGTPALPHAASTRATRPAAARHSLRRHRTTVPHRADDAEDAEEKVDEDAPVEDEDVAAVNTDEPAVSATSDAGRPAPAARSQRRRAPSTGSPRPRRTPSRTPSPGGSTAPPSSAPVAAPSTAPAAAPSDTSGSGAAAPTPAADPKTPEPDDPDTTPPADPGTTTGEEPVVTAPQDPETPAP